VNSFREGEERVFCHFGGEVLRIKEKGRGVTNKQNLVPALLHKLI
jgi:hypothetical protein